LRDVEAGAAAKTLRSTPSPPTSRRRAGRSSALIVPSPKLPTSRALLNWPKPAGARARKAIETVLRRARPLFVAFEHEAALKKRHRGKRFSSLLTRACDDLGVIVLSVKSRQTKAFSTVKNPTKWDIADALAKLFPEISDRLPARRKAWQTESDRIGLFMALGAAVAAWESFRGTRR
jgi:hypothetical protein